MDSARANSIIPDRYRDGTTHMVGIKGTGMSSLAALLHLNQVRVTGSDSGESFYTDALLQKLGIPVRSSCGAQTLGTDVGVVVYSTAYDPARHPELVAARERGIVTRSYPEALGEISALTDSSGIAGSHGKTTTAALSAVLCRALALPATVIVPTLLPDLDGMPVYAGGTSFLVAETCEVEFVPEPGTLMLLGSGLAGLAGYATLRWRTRE